MTDTGKGDFKKELDELIQDATQKEENRLESETIETCEAFLATKKKIATISCFGLALTVGRMEAERLLQICRDKKTRVPMKLSNREF